MEELRLLLDKYNLEYIFNKKHIELWRNGYRKIIRNQHLKYVDETVIEDFCAMSPNSLNSLKKLFPLKFISPKLGDYIAIKRSDEYRVLYSIEEFKCFRDDKVVCFGDLENEETFWDFYQILSEDGSHPYTNLWINSKGNLVNHAVIEKLNIYPELTYE